MLTPIVIDDVQPRTPGGFAAKAVSGQPLLVSAVLVADGHDQLAARVRWRPVGSDEWHVSPLQDSGNSRWEGSITATEIGAHELVIDAWTDRYATWRHEIDVKVAAGQDVELELAEGALLLEDLAAKRPRPAERDRLQAAATAIRRTSCTLEVRRDAAADDEVVALVSTLPDTRLSSSGPHPLWVDRPAAAHAAWYELFPRSFGGFRGTAEHLPYVADLGFDVVYLPPIHPIGVTHRKGRDNSLTPSADDPGSPWAIGSAEGGHDAVRPRARDDGGLRRPRRRRHRARPRDRARLRAAVQPRPPLGARPPGVVHPAARRLDPVRREPAQEVPGHPPDQLLAGQGRRPHRPLGGVPRHPRALDRARRPDVPGRQPAHQAAAVLGVGDRRRPRAATRTSCSWPRRSPTPP